MLVPARGSHELLGVQLSAGSIASFVRPCHQQLAEVEMEFVAGVSHELRTPLTVIRTAAFNLRGRVASNPSQVERYGALIQQESERFARRLLCLPAQPTRLPAARTPMPWMTTSGGMPRPS